MDLILCPMLFSIDFHCKWIAINRIFYCFCKLSNIDQKYVSLTYIIHNILCFCILGSLRQAGWGSWLCLLIFGNTQLLFIIKSHHVLMLKRSYVKELLVCIALSLLMCLSNGVLNYIFKEQRAWPVTQNQVFIVGKVGWFCCLCCRGKQRRFK